MKLPKIPIEKLKPEYLASLSETNQRRIFIMVVSVAAIVFSIWWSNRPRAVAQVLPPDEAPKTLEEPAGIPDHTIDACNVFMKKIHWELLKARGPQNPELAAYSDDALDTNSYGIIRLSYADPSGGADPFQFEVTIVPESDRPYTEDAFDDPFGSYKFGLLEMRMAGFVRGYQDGVHISLHSLVNRHREILDLHQQQYLTLRLNMQVVDSYVYVGQKPTIEVALTNTGEEPMQVRALSQDSFQFWLNGNTVKVQPVILPEPQGMLQLPSYETMRSSFRFPPVTRAGPNHITIIYRMAMRGVAPTATTDIQVIGY